MRILDIKNNFSEENNVDFHRGSYWIILNEIEAMERKTEFKIDQCYCEEIVQGFQPSKITFFDGFIFISINLLDYKESQLNTLELDLILTKENVLMIPKKNMELINNFTDEVIKCSYILKKEAKCDILVYYILDRIIVNNYTVISNIEVETDRIEISILKGPKRIHIDELIRLRRVVFKIRKYINPLRYIGDALVSNDNQVISSENSKYFEGLEGKIDKLIQALESLVSDIGQVREAFEAETANKTNELMKAFSLITGIFFPVSIITSIFGMDIKNMPLADNDYAFYIIFVIMIIASGILIYFFKKKRWL